MNRYVDSWWNWAKLCHIVKCNHSCNYVLVFLIRSIVNSFKFSLANFVTNDISASQMFLLLWKAISIWEKSSLRFISVTCDGTSANGKLLRMHCHLKQDDDMNPETDVPYRTHNLFSGTKTDSFTLFLKFHIY